MPATATSVDADEDQHGPGCQSTIEAGSDRAAAADRLPPLGHLDIALVFGLPLFLVLAGVLTWWSVDRVEGRVEAEVRAGLVEVGVDPDEVDIEVRYRDVAVDGSLPPGVVVGAVESVAAAAVVGDLDLDALTEAPPERLPSVGAEGEAVATGPVRVSVSYDGRMVSVTGTVLNEGQHDVILETIDLVAGRAEVNGRLVISRLAPAVEGADARIADLVTAMASMDPADEWSIRLTDRGLAIEAVIADPEAAAAVGALGGQLTATPTTIDVTGPDVGGET